MLLPLLAQTLDPDTTVDAIRSAFHRPPAWNDKFFGTLWVVLALALIGWAVRMLWPRKKSPANSATDAFELLARRLKLSPQEATDLRKLARRAGRAQIATTLLSPMNFAVVLQRSEKKEVDPHVRKRAVAFAERFFQKPLPTPAPLTPTTIVATALQIPATIAAPTEPPRETSN